MSSESKGSCQSSESFSFIDLIELFEQDKKSESVSKKPLIKDNSVSNGID